jgi:hypothetical protein
MADFSFATMKSVLRGMGGLPRGAAAQAEPLPYLW